MSGVGNLQFDLADELAQRERDAGIASARIALKRGGQAECTDCDEPIAPARRRALPSAERCIPCQARHERTRRRGS